MVRNVFYIVMYTMYTLNDTIFPDIIYIIKKFVNCTVHTRWKVTGNIFND